MMDSKNNKKYISQKVGENMQFWIKTYNFKNLFQKREADSNSLKFDNLTMSFGETKAINTDNGFRRRFFCR